MKTQIDQEGNDNGDQDVNFSIPTVKKEDWDRIMNNQPTKEQCYAVSKKHLDKMFKNREKI